MRNNLFANPNDAREAYLAEIGSHLRLRMSAFELYDSIQEMRAHIDATAAAYEELGLDPSAAMAAALEKFGEADHIAESVSAVCRPAPRIGFVRAVLYSVAVEVVLGALLMIAIDLALSAATYRYVANISVDITIGAFVGFLVGSVAWLAPFKPRQYAAGLCLIVNLLLTFTLYRTYLAMHETQMAVEIGVGTTLAFYFLAWKGARMARRAAAWLSDDLPGPMKRV